MTDHLHLESRFKSSALNRSFLAQMELYKLAELWQFIATTREMNYFELR